MIESRSLKVGGATVFWGLGEWTDLARLGENLGAVGFGDCVPERRPQMAALRDALEAQMGGPCVLIRPLVKKDGFTVVKEERGVEENEYSNLMRVRLEKLADDSTKLLFAPWDHRAQAITESYNKHLGLLRAGQVATALVKIITRLRATTLRPTGGLYWVPDESLAAWRDVALAVEQSAAEGKRHSVYTMLNVMDAEAVRAVRDAVVAEITADAARIYEEVFSGELGDKALANRKEQAELLREKCALYEELLGLGLSDVRAAIGRAEESFAAATLLEAAGAEGE